MSNSDRTDLCVEPLGDRALVVRLGDCKAPADPQMMADTAELLRIVGPEWMEDAVSAYDTVTIVYDPVKVLASMSEAERSLRLPYEQTIAQVESLLHREHKHAAGRPRLIDIPVCYGGAYGPDLQEAAERAELSVQSFVELHASPEYTVAMIGFMPGFPYLTGLPRELSQPRKASPRSRVPAGSVGIAGGQTGIYPFSSPGGWQLIGRTPMELFRSAEEEPSLLRAGDRIRFVPIGKQQMEAWGDR
ncbi:5-oxoprolinase subunit PxpB [Paenibacillus oenotherae]|uniref:5-oxoprolinase subunit PxpB n=1 Tax=Paenibacillus oenotherae TaxID=1435645 RepID=A0ABS7D3E0_9BACL|nr:5-oxoprolinase subunit PxpB [Paenibacillus oenotherae]